MSDPAHSTKRFQRHPESFTCEVCGTFVEGDGYTDHCPNCLWSKHVDIYPGDRADSCRGLMEPVGCTKKADGYIIHYRCILCSKTHSVKAQTDDNRDLLVELSSRPVPSD